MGFLSKILVKAFFLYVILSGFFYMVVMLKNILFFIENVR
jgi:hypothetical protein